VRVNGRAHLSVEPALLDPFVVEGKAPRSVIVIAVDSVYFQCARAIARSDLWNPERHRAPVDLPSPGQILAGVSGNRVGGEAYDRAWPERARKTMW
jgi:predicted pyridoxine 5'-phosphate oxidase superfamily flavin-nucleotide-binding protein